MSPEVVKGLRSKLIFKGWIIEGLKSKFQCSGSPRQLSKNLSCPSKLTDNFFPRNLRYKKLFSIFLPALFWPNSSCSLWLFPKLNFGPKVPNLNFFDYLTNLSIFYFFPKFPKFHFLTFFDIFQVGNPRRLPGP